jgi:hypothetical protein
MGFEQASDFLKETGRKWFLLFQMNRRNVME